MRRRLVDATYMESALPSTHSPPFSVDPDARVVTPNDLVSLSGFGTTLPPNGFAPEADARTLARQWAVTQRAVAAWTAEPDLNDWLRT